MARLINKPTKLISYAGLKDRQALTIQWISIHAPGEVIPDIEKAQTNLWRVLEATRHHKKLRPGYLAGNHFVLRLRDAALNDELIDRIERIKQQGVPNYFGDQRFGRDAGNLNKAEHLLVQGHKVKDRFLRGLYCSAARSWIFNLILAERVTNQTWNIPLPGDVMMLSGTQSIFTSTEVDETLSQRIKDKDISPACPLPGKKKKLEQHPAEFIARIYADWEPWITGLERLGLEESWRNTILHVSNFTYQSIDNTILLTFTLPAGAYATTVLRELTKLTKFC